MTSDPTDTPRPYRPALVTLTDGIRDRVQEFEDGFDDPDRVLGWTQEMTVRTLGNLDDLIYRDLARQFHGDGGVLLAALLQPHARSHEFDDLDDDTVRRLREKLVAEFVMPAYQQAFRELRTDATEYVDDAGDGDEHDPHRQSFIAMRPALTELGEWQERALTRLLDGFDERGDILDWGSDVVLATHGELEREFVTRAYRERGTANVLTGTTPQDANARRLFAAHHLLPRFRDGIRVLFGRAGETASAEKEVTEVQFA